MQEESDPSTCVLCPPTGPPTPPTAKPHNGITDSSSFENQPDPSTAASSADGVDAILSWVGCSKCPEWYHGVCVLQHSPETRDTVPESIRKYTVEHGSGDWTDWTRWVDKWFCHKCIAHSQDPSNPHPPRYPLVATIDNKKFPPKPKVTKQRQSTKRSLSSAPNEGDSIDKPKTKKRKTESNGRVNGSPALTSHGSAGPVENGVGVNDDGDREETKADKSAAANGPTLSGVEPPDHVPLPDEVKVVSNAEEAQEDKEGGEDKEGEEDKENKEDRDGSMARPKRTAALNRPDYHALHHHIATPTARWLDLIHNPEKYNTKISDGNFPRVPAQMLTRAWLDSQLPDASLPPTLWYGATREPLIVRPEDGGFEGLGGKLPASDLTVADVARLVGPDKVIPVIDVATQQSAQWSLQKWADYVAQRFGQEPTSDTGPMSKTYNVISLEISGTDLGNKVKPPRIVSEIDWVDNCWDFGPGGKEAAMREDALKWKMENEAKNGKDGTKKDRGKNRDWPKVQLYCLMGAKGSWTDWHCDFAASSVYYTIHTGAKTFFFIRPTAKNLAAYADWSGSYEKQQTVWLGDLCDEVRRVELKQGDTMMIPAGYIHCVYTPADSIVFGGNFLHSYDIPTQLRLRQIEIDTKVPMMFRFPYFDKLCWYVAEKHCAQMRLARQYRSKGTAEIPPVRVLQGLLALSSFLIGQCDIMDDQEAEDKKRKFIHDRIPAVVKDGPALARELRWRVIRELPADDAAAEMLENRNGEHKEEKPLQRALKKKATTNFPPKAPSRTWNHTATAWNDSPPLVEQRTNTVSLTPPSEATLTAVAIDDKAEEHRTLRKQSRSRHRALADGSIVREEQELSLVDRTVIWYAKVEDTGAAPKEEAQGKQETDGMCVD